MKPVNMMEPRLVGAREGWPNWLRRLVGRATAASLNVFVVPDLEFAQAAGLDLGAVGLRPVANPRHAKVLLLLGNLPQGLAEAAGFVYAQMLRPKAVFMLGDGGTPSAALPDFDVSEELSQAGLARGVSELRRLFATSAWAPHIDGYSTPFVDSQTGDQDQDNQPGEDKGEKTTEGDSPDPDSEQDEPKDSANEQKSQGHTGHAHGHQSPEIDHTQMGQGQPAEMGMAKEGTEHPEPHSSDPEGPDHTEGNAQMEMDGSDDQGGRGHSMGHGNMSGMDHNTDHSQMDHDHNMDHMKMSGMNHGNMGGMDHGSMDHMDMSMGGFMSMVEMTKDLPRSQDGLQMEWVETPFGPLFRGLPGGLMLKFTLDGDVVARAEVEPGSLKRSIAAEWPGPAANFPAKLAWLNPLAPLAYQVLAWKALENAAGQPVDETVAYQRVVPLERERMVNHLGLVAGLAYLLGARQLAGSASELQIRLARPLTQAQFRGSWSEVNKLCRSALKTPLLKSRLKNVAILSPQSLKDLGGSAVVRAMNQAADARLSDPAYLASGFKPVVRDGGDALARFEVYLGELEQSFGLVEAATALLLREPGQPVDNLFEVGGITGPFEFNFAFERNSQTGSTSVEGHPRPGTATIETPHGPASLSLTLEAGQVKEVKLETPSKRRLPLVGQVAQGQDLADALVGVASLNLSPWELDY